MASVRKGNSPTGFSSFSLIIPSPGYRAILSGERVAAVYGAKATRNAVILLRGAQRLA
jgi:hypothetical protein